MEDLKEKLKSHNIIVTETPNDYYGGFSYRYYWPEVKRQSGGLHYIFPLTQQVADELIEDYNNSSPYDLYTAADEEVK